MSTETRYKCDQCGETKPLTNAWMRINIDGITWRSKVQRHDYDICSYACEKALLGKLANEPIDRARVEADIADMSPDLVGENARLKAEVDRLQSVAKAAANLQQRNNDLAAEVHMLRSQPIDAPVTMRDLRNLLLDVLSSPRNGGEM